MEKIFRAARRGQVKKVAKLIDRGVDIDIREMNETPLWCAAERGHTEVVKLLLEAGAEVEKTCFGITPLWRAAEKGRTEVVKVLINWGADINTTSNGTTILHENSKFSQKEVVRLLLENGANVNSRDKEQWCPLHVAVFSNNRYLTMDQDTKDKNQEEVVKLLLDFGADLDANLEGDLGGVQPLHLACIRGRRNLLEVLLDAGSDINAVDNMGRTPLNFAMSLKFNDCVNLLIERGAI